MTSIDKLLIQGIRSFSPQNRNIIEFYKPLTIIVGQNGAGKTTVIECLKYACTGDLPPNSKNGQAFIHDTKVAGEREIKAQIKLRFKSVNGKPIVCTRSLQLSQKATKQECKTLESALQTYNAQGEKVSQSYRCADLDKEIPELMGVSKPILENVIFCHQEESNWPLSDSATLKKKFDDIFAATRYTKALEAIKKERKEQSQMLREYKLKLETIQTNKENADKLRKELEVNQLKVQEADEEIRHLKDIISQKEQRLNQLRKKQTGAQEEIQEVIKLRATRQQLVQQSKHTYESEIQSEFTESDEELRELERRFDMELQKLEKQELGLTQKIKNLEAEKVQLERQVQALSEEFGRLQTLVKSQQNLITERDNHIVSFTKRYKIPGYEHGPFSEIQCKTLLQQTAQILDQLKDRIQDTKRDFQQRTQTLEKSLDNFKAEQVSHRERYNQSVSQLEDAKRRVIQLENELKKKESYRSQLNTVEEQQKSEQESLKALKSNTISEENFHRKVEEMKAEKKAVDGQIAELAKLMKSLNVQASARAKLNLLKTERSKRQESYSSLFQSKKQEFTNVLGAVPNDLGQLKIVLEKAIKHKKELANEMNKKYQEERGKASVFQGQIKSAEDQMKKIENEMKTREGRLNTTIGHNRELPDLLRDAEQNMEKKKKDVTMTQSAKIMYENFVSLAGENHECPLCERSFDRDRELSAFITKLQGVIDRVPESLRTGQQAITECETLLKSLRKLQPDWEFVSRAKTVDYPETQSNLNELKDQERELNSQVEQTLTKLKALQAEEQTAVALVSDAESIVRNFNDFQRFSKEVEEEERKLREIAADTRTVEEVTAEYDQLQKKAEELNEQMDSLRRELTGNQEKIHQKEQLLHSLATEILNMKGASDEINRIRKERMELEQSFSRLEQESKTHKQQVDQLEGKIQELSQERQKLQKTAAEQESKVQSEKDMFQSKLSYLESLEKQLENYYANPVNIEKVQENKKSVENQLNEIGRNMKSHSEQIDEIRDALAQRHNTKRNIQDNIKYRQQLKEIQQLEATIRAKEAALGGVNVEAAEFEEELAKLEKEWSALKTKHDRLSGSKATVTEQITSHTKELNKPAYRTVDDEHRKMLIQLKTTEMAYQDLEKYYKALDKALMKYHSVKMEEINKIIKELWQATYKGNDIDTIELRSDNENNARSSYNYRVVMVKQDTELDMRGRCSAGQKVLASLVIRLALAETFCINCGILTLDEPTTNLDRHNVESFANALVSIIETRRQQSNFQLVIITHDEEFVQLIGKSELADYYWRVSKDNHGHSSLERQDISELA